MCVQKVNTLYHKYYMFMYGLYILLTCVQKLRKMCNRNGRTGYIQRNTYMKCRKKTQIKNYGQTGNPTPVSRITGQAIYIRATQANIHVTSSRTTTLLSLTKSQSRRHTTKTRSDNSNSLFKPILDPHSFSFYYVKTFPLFPVTFGA